jgi:hypothetical protein
MNWLFKPAAESLMPFERGAERPNVLRTHSGEELEVVAGSCRHPVSTRGVLKQKRADLLAFSLCQLGGERYESQAKP